MYGKIIENKLVFAPDVLEIGELNVWNPSDEQYEDAGYKKLVFTDPPVCEEGYHAEYYWRETAKQIRQEWNVVQDPPAEAEVDDFIEALEDLGVNINDES